MGYSNQTPFRPVQHAMFPGSGFLVIHINTTDLKILQDLVVMLTYMRGGSSFIGELFNHHEDAMYYFEPISGVYRSLYGFSDDLKPMLISHYMNGTARFVLCWICC